MSSPDPHAYALQRLEHDGWFIVTSPLTRMVAVRAIRTLRIDEPETRYRIIIVRKPSHA